MSMCTPRRSIASALGARPRRSYWPLLVFGLLAFNAAIVVATVYCAGSDPAVAIEPDYYAKALRYDDMIQSREQSERLGWVVSALVVSEQEDSTGLLVVTLADREGRPVSASRVSVVAFAHVRAADRQALGLTPDMTTPGRYCGPIRLKHRGLWRLNITANRGPDAFVAERDVLTTATAAH